MKKMLFLAVILGIIFSGNVFSMEYKHHLPVDTADVYWTMEAEKIHFKLTAKTEGWVGIGFDPEKEMQGADIIIGAVRKGKVRVEDHYGDGKRNHSSDEKLGGSNDVIDPAGSETDGVTTISFTLMLDRKDKYDKPINKTGMTRVIISHGRGRDSFRANHDFRRIYDIDFSTGEAKKIK